MITTSSIVLWYCDNKWNFSIMKWEEPRQFQVGCSAPPPRGIHTIGILLYEPGTSFCQNYFCLTDGRWRERGRIVFYIICVFSTLVRMCEVTLGAMPVSLRRFAYDARSRCHSLVRLPWDGDSSSFIPLLARRKTKPGSRASLWNPWFPI